MGRKELDLHTSFTISLTRLKELRTPTYTVFPFLRTLRLQSLTTFPSLTMQPAARPLPLVNTARTSTEPIVTCSCQKKTVAFSFKYTVTIIKKKNAKVRQGE